MGFQWVCVKWACKHDADWNLIARRNDEIITADNSDLGRFGLSQFGPYFSFGQLGPFFGQFGHRVIGSEFPKVKWI